MKRRGGYGHLIHQVKVRLSPETMRKLQDLSEQKNFSVAFIIREFINRCLAKQES